MKEKTMKKKDQITCVKCGKRIKDETYVECPLTFQCFHKKCANSVWHG